MYLSIRKAYWSLAILAVLFGLVASTMAQDFAGPQGESSALPRDAGLPAETLARFGLEPLEAELFDYNIELLPGLSYQGWYYFWSTGDTLAAAFVEQIDVPWLTLSGNNFTSTGCNDIAPVGFHFSAPVVPGIYTAVVEDLNGNWDDVNVTLIVSENPLAADVFTFAANAGDTVLYTDDEDWDGFSLGCLNPYFPGSTQAYVIAEFPEAPWMTINPTAFTLGEFEVKTIEFSMTSEVNGDFSTHVVYHKEWRSRPKLFRYEFNVTGAPEITITSPAAGDLLVVGSTATIQWTSSAVDTVNIYYSTDYDGGSGTFDEIAVGVAADAGSFDWVVPEALSRKCAIRITDASDPSHTAESSIFYIKGYILTRINIDDDYQRFNPLSDVWYFDNDSDILWPSTWYLSFDYANGLDPYTNWDYPFGFANYPLNAVPKTFPDWPLFVNTFGTDQCYYNLDGAASIYSLGALYRWDDINQDGSTGGCYGMATASLLAFFHKSAFIQRYGLSDFSSLATVDLNTESRIAINSLWTAQFGQAQIAHTNLNYQKTPTQTLQELKDRFISNDADGVTLTYRDINGSFAHTVTPYQIKSDENDPDREFIYVNDNNFPLSIRWIVVDKIQNTWETQDGRSGTSYFFLELPAANYLQTLVLSASSSGTSLASSAKGSRAGANPLRVFSSGSHSVSIRNSAGDSLFFDNSDSTYLASIPDARPLIAATGRVTPPYGYSLPQGQYTIELDAFLDTNVRISAVIDSAHYAFRRSDALSGQLDQITSGDGIGYVNSDPQSKQIHLQAAILEDSSGQVADILNLDATQEGTFQLERLPEGDIELQNLGLTASAYQLHLVNASPAGDHNFESVAINLTANSTHQIQPNWNDFGEPVTILIDEGNNGTVDDTISVGNLVSLDVSPGNGSVPAKFALAQNYPNPFNPETTIEFELPVASVVTLTIYDIIGRHVETPYRASLLPVGHHKFTWDATDDTGNSVPSGVYFYRLVVDKQFSQTRKMLLVR